MAGSNLRADLLAYIEGGNLSALTITEEARVLSENDVVLLAEVVALVGHGLSTFRLSNESRFSPQLGSTVIQLMSSVSACCNLKELRFVDVCLPFE
jgi:hypothetical protein